MPPPHIVKAGCQPLTTIIIEVGIVLRIGRRESTRPPPPKKNCLLNRRPLNSLSLAGIRSFLKENID